MGKSKLVAFGSLKVGDSFKDAHEDWIKTSYTDAKSFDGAYYGKFTPEYHVVKSTKKKRKPLKH